MKSEKQINQKIDELEKTKSGMINLAEASSDTPIYQSIMESSLKINQSIQERIDILKWVLKND